MEGTRCVRLKEEGRERQIERGRQEKEKGERARKLNKRVKGRIGV